MIVYAMNTSLIRHLLSMQASAVHSKLISSIQWPILMIRTALSSVILCTAISLFLSSTSDLVMFIDEKAQSTDGVHTVGMFLYRIETSHELDMS